MTEEIEQSTPLQLACPASVRCGTPADEDAMMDFLMVMHAENGMATLKLDKVRDLLRRALKFDHAIVGVICGPDRIEASVGLVVGSWWYTDDQHLEDFWNFVHPDHRRSNHAKDLIHFAKWVSHKMGFPLMMGILSSERTAAKVRLYQRQLGQPVGALFVTRA